MGTRKHRAIFAVMAVLGAGCSGGDAGQQSSHVTFRVTSLTFEKSYTGFNMNWTVEGVDSQLLYDLSLYVGREPTEKYVIAEHCSRSSCMQGGTLFCGYLGGSLGCSTNLAGSDTNAEVGALVEGAILPVHGKICDGVQVPAVCTEKRDEIDVSN